MRSISRWFRNRIERLKKDQRGFSMVEIIITLAVMGLLASSAFSLMNYLKYADVQKAYKTIGDQINKLQVDSMSKKSKQEIQIYKIGLNTYMKVGTSPMALDDKGIMLGNGALTIKGVDAAGAEFTVTETTPIKIKYQRSGIFSAETNVTKIIVSGKTSSYTWKLIKNTGKVKEE